MKRPLQWSHLTSGLPIPKVFQELTYDILGRRLNVQDSAEVRVMFGGEIFNVKIAKPHFNRKTLSFEFPNGLIEKVKINRHL